ncbi:hypothetical protein [Sinomonas albida]|uniref:hypothetical protein n=1 Tax=Sinomonas albida TaxID=369942 RepID=UPI003017FE16
MTDWLGDPAVLDVIASLSGIALGGVGVHLTAPGAYSRLAKAVRGSVGDVLRHRIVAAPTGIESGATVSSNITATSEVTAKLSSTDLEARVAILEGEVAQTTDRMKALQSDHRDLKAAQGELLAKFERLATDTQKAIDEIEDRQSEIDAIGLPVVLAGIIVGSWPSAWLNAWAVFAAIGAGTGVAIVSWQASRKHRAARSAS